MEHMMTDVPLEEEAMNMTPEEVTISVLEEGDLGGVEFEILPDGSVEISLGEGEDEEEDDFDANLAETLEEGVLSSISREILDDIEDDINSRKDWEETFTKGLEVLGLRYEERTEPWIGACGVYSTVLTEAAIRFQSETVMETFPAGGPVRTEIIGEETIEKIDAAHRVSEDMNYQITERMPEYRPEHERMLFSLGLIGAAFKKVYYDPSLGRQTSIFVPAEDVIIPYGSSGAQSSERVTHVMRKTKNQLKKLQVSGFYRDVELGDPAPVQTDLDKKKAEFQGYVINDDDRYQLLEVQIDLNLEGHEDEDGVALPYIVTLDKGTGTVLSVYRNWKKDDPYKAKRQHFVQYTYIPGFGAYGFGLIHLIGGYARAGTSIMRELVDAGQLANLPGGMKTRGLRIVNNDTPISPGEFRDVDVSSGTLKDSIMPLPYKEPSQTLLALLEKMTEEARRLGAVSDMSVSDMSANAPVGSTLAILERTLKIMSAVQARVHNSMKQEFKLLAAIIKDHSEDEYDYQPASGNRAAKRSDYDMVDVIPVSDPNSSTMAQRIMQYQAAIQLAQQAPQIYDLPNLHRQMLEVLGIKNAAKLVPVDEDMKPRDPVSENMAFLNGKPTKAFLYQDHDAHLTVHMSFMQDPLIAQAMGQNPQAQAMAAAIQAHIAQHVAFKYRAQVQERLGATLTAPDAELPEAIELQLSKVAAEAAKQVLSMNQNQAAQQQAQQQMQDPLVQMQMQELQIKAKEADTNAQKVQGELQLKAQELQLKAQQAGENPQKMQQELQIAAQKAQNEAQLAIQKAQMEMTIKSQKAQQEAALRRQKHQQEAQIKNQTLQQQSIAKQQELRHGAAAKQQELLHKEQAHKQGLEQQKAAAAAAAKQQAKPAKKEDK